MSKTELVNKGTSYLEHMKDNVQVFSYKGEYVYMDDDGTHIKKSLPSDVQDDVWKLSHMRSESLDKLVERLKYKRISFGNLKVVYFNDQNIFTSHGDRMDIGEFLSTLFYDMTAPTSELLEEEFLKYNKRVQTMTGLVMAHYPNLSVKADLHDSWAIELYKLDVQNYIEEGKYGTRLQDMCKVLEELGKEEAIKDQFAKTISIRWHYPFDLDQYSNDTNSESMLEHYISCIKYEPNCWVPDLFELLVKYVNHSDAYVKLIEDHANSFRGIFTDLNVA